eukprot:9206831-Pyramimonas_sp.AAC.1
MEPMPGPPAKPESEAPGPPAKPESEAPRPRQKHLQPNPDVGLNTMTAVMSKGVRVGWEAACRHPLHNIDSKCRLSRRFGVRTGVEEEQLFRMLEMWLARGADLHDKLDHLFLWQSIQL